MLTGRLEWTPKLRASVDALVAAAPVLPIESQRIMADILGPAYARFCARTAAAAERPAVELDRAA